MNLTQTQTLQNMIDGALDTLKQLQSLSLKFIDRERRTERSQLEETKSSKNLRPDLGVTPRLLDCEILIPRKFNNLVYGGNDWKQVDESTFVHFDNPILLLEAHALANLKKADRWRCFRQAAARSARGNLTLKFGQLGQIARKGRGKSRHAMTTPPSSERKKP